MSWLKTTKGKEQLKLDKNIAIVQFYDSRVNNFGKVLTNALGINNEDTSGKLYTFNLNERNWKSEVFPEEDVWIIMNPSTFRGRREAIMVIGWHMTKWTFISSSL